MATFIELSVHIEKQRWENRLLNMDNCISIFEHDASQTFTTRRVAEPFASQPLFCLLTMVYPDGTCEKLWVHASRHIVVTKIGIANHADNFTEPIDTASIQREWTHKKQRFTF